MALQDPEGTTLDFAAEVWGVAHYPDGRPIPPEESSIARALRGETTVGREALMIRPDGSHHNVLISAAPPEERGRRPRGRGSRLAGHNRAQTGGGGAGSSARPRDRDAVPERRT